MLDNNGQTGGLRSALSALHVSFDSILTMNQPSSFFPLLAVTIGVLLYTLLWKLASPAVDPREPPVLWPKMPVIGHVVSILRESNGYYARIYKRNPVPICTLPVMGGKIYNINSPALIASAMRNKDLSFEAHAKRWAIGAIGITERQFQLIMPQYDELNETIHSSLTGKNLYQMNAAALRDVADTLNAIRPESGLHVPDVFLWLRDLMSLATMKALFGEKNPVTSKTVDSLWDYEQSVAQLALNVKPEWTAPKGLRARTQMQETLRPYFMARHDQRGDAAEVIRKRSDQYRKMGLRSEELGVISFDLLFASTTNTIPTLFWMFALVFSAFERVRRVRDEVIAVMEMATDAEGARIASIDISKLEKSCPYLLGCYRETLRLYTDNLGQRRVLQDTVISDGSGKDYLLKEDCLVSWSPSVCHLNPAIFGDDVESFNPERWVNPSPEEEKRRRGAFIPFGGGRNLCPGRMFAQAELLGFVSAVALGYIVEGVHVPPALPPYLGTGARRPKFGKTDRSIRVKRRDGWGDVTWRFIC